MSATISKRDNVVKKNLSKWDTAIEDAKKGIRRLEIAIEDCRAKKAAGEPWPGSQLEGQNSESCHSV
jgi:predicted  nucleic acid-binding Zn-ribbon protein